MTSRTGHRDALLPQALPGLRFAAHRAAIEQAMARVFARGQFILGEEVAAFETEFAEYLGARHVVTVSSGTQALCFALSALGVKPGDEVVTVAMTFAATAAAIELTGARPVFVDVDPVTRCMDPRALEAAIGPATVAILPVDLHGCPADMDAINAVARRHGLAVLADCAQSHGASIGGRRTGTLAHASVFSFYPTKLLGAAGDGGAVVTDDAALAERVMRLRNYGFDETARAIELGTNGRLDELQAAILRVMLPDLDRQIRRRRALAAQFRAQLNGAPLELPAAHDGAVHYQFAVALEQRDEVRQRLRIHHRIGTGVHFELGVHQHPHFARRGLVLPVTERLARRMLSLPIQPEVAEGHVDEIAAAVIESIGACR